MWSFRADELVKKQECFVDEAIKNIIENQEERMKILKERMDNQDKQIKIMNEKVDKLDERVEKLLKKPTYIEKVVGDFHM